MTYRIRFQHSVQANLHQIARDQIEKSIAEIGDAELDRHEVVHQVRKRCKKIRGLIRLVRPGFDDYKAENRYFRDAARELSYVRDAHSMIECFDGLMKRYEEHVDASSFANLREELLKRRKVIADDEVGLNQKLEVFLAKMRVAGERVSRWKIDQCGFSAVEGGLRKTYKRGRMAFRLAYDAPTDENLHELRKRVKYHWYHTGLLLEIWPRMMRAEREASDELSDLLGDDHDLAVLRQTLIDDVEILEVQVNLGVLRGLIDERRRELQARAKRQAEWIYAEKASQISNRYHSYWKTWMKSH